MSTIWGTVQKGQKEKSKDSQEPKIMWKDLTFTHGQRNMIIDYIFLGGGKSLLLSDNQNPLVFRGDKNSGYIYEGGKGVAYFLQDGKIEYLSHN